MCMGISVAMGKLKHSCPELVLVEGILLLSFGSVILCSSGINTLNSVCHARMVLSLAFVPCPHLSIGLCSPARECPSLALFPYLHVSVG
jgi:hypothetical protein